MCEWLLKSTYLEMFNYPTTENGREISICWGVIVLGFTTGTEQSAFQKLHSDLLLPSCMTGGSPAKDKAVQPENK